MGRVSTEPDPATEPTPSVDDLGAALRDIVEFVDAQGWGLPPMLFALVPTAVLAATQPGLIDPDDDSVLSPVAQEPIPTAGHDEDPGTALEQVLATTTWPEMVAGAAVIQEIVVLPPGADATGAPHTHPDRRTARLVVGALRNRTTLALLHLQPDSAQHDENGSEALAEIELLTRHDLATDLRNALAHTFDDPTPDTAG
ncbi:PPA1309 family protein [Gordonia sp. PKS22-38]|uniref:PPA1309 family protein n=1 Tax=Gordonia prachuapensis TaxID=3115651 RepID=A0ABU7MNA1_9ACTN|nr:PPA1309 family protein [Gordonia sp. PKS22-38]